MAERIGASEAKAHSSELLARAGFSGERFLVDRRGKPLAALVGTEDLKRLKREASVEAGTHARGIRVGLEKEGTPIGDADLRTASIALSRRLTMATPSS